MINSHWPQAPRLLTKMSLVLNFHTGSRCYVEPPSAGGMEVSSGSAETLSLMECEGEMHLGPWIYVHWTKCL